MNKQTIGGFTPLITLLIIGTLTIVGGATVLYSSLLQNKGSQQNNPSTQQNQIFTDQDKNDTTTQQTPKQNSNPPTPSTKKEQQQTVPQRTTYQPDQKSAETTKTDESAQPIKAVDEFMDTKNAINTFLDNPTLEGFGKFCMVAKTLKIPENKEVLNTDRTKMETVNITLYEKIHLCSDYLHDNDYDQSVVFVEPNSEDDFTIKFSDSDSDGIRIRKIAFNDKVKELQKYKFYAFKLFLANEKTASKNPSIYFEKQLESTNRIYKYNDFIHYMIAPEEQIKDLKEEYKL